MQLHLHYKENYGYKPAHLIKAPCQDVHPCGTSSWCLFNWSDLANPVLFVHPGKVHLYDFECFWRWALCHVSNWYINAKLMDILTWRMNFAWTLSKCHLSNHLFYSYFRADIHALLSPGFLLLVATHLSCHRSRLMMYRPRSHSRMIHSD